MLSTVITSMKKEKGLLSVKVSEGDLMSPGGPPAYSKVVESSWEALEDFMAWVQNQPQDVHSTKDSLIEKGAVLLFYEVKDLT